jgi:hypothetical protein
VRKTFLPLSPRSEVQTWALLSLTRKVKGKTVSRFLNEENAKECKEWIANHRELEAILKKMRKLSQKAANWHR